VATDAVIRSIAARFSFRVMNCSTCGEEMVMSEESAVEADKHLNWMKACLPCVCKAKGIPYPDSNLPQT
jgi:hypothetical protein